MPSTMAAPWTPTYRTMPPMFRYRVALAISAMPYRVAAQQSPSSTRSACWMKSARMAFSRFHMGVSISSGAEFDECSIPQMKRCVNAANLFLQTVQNMVY